MWFVVYVQNSHKQLLNYCEILSNIRFSTKHHHQSINQYRSHSLHMPGRVGRWWAFFPQRTCPKDPHPSLWWGHPVPGRCHRSHSSNNYKNDNEKFSWITETAEKCLTVIISSYGHYSVLQHSLTWSRRWHLPAGCRYSGNGWNLMTLRCGCSSQACWLYGSQPCPRSSKCPAGERRTPIRRRGESPHLSGKQQVNINQGRYRSHLCASVLVDHLFQCFHMPGEEGLWSSCVHWHTCHEGRGPSQWWVCPGPPGWWRLCLCHDWIH